MDPVTPLMTIQLVCVYACVSVCRYPGRQGEAGYGAEKRGAGAGQDSPEGMAVSATVTEVQTKVDDLVAQQRTQVCLCVRARACACVRACVCVCVRARACLPSSARRWYT